jgi:hypothetical protein
MATAMLTPRLIVERLQIIDALVAEGRPRAEALRFAGMTEAAYNKWRAEYAGLMRTLGPMLRAPEKPRKRRRRPASGPDELPG